MARNPHAIVKTAAMVALEVEYCFEKSLLRWSYRRIAEEAVAHLGYPLGKSTVAARIAQWSKEHVDPSAEQHRERDIATLDLMMERISADIDQGDLKAIDRGIRILERRARLRGYDAPAVVEVTHTVTTPFDERIAALNAQLGLGADPTLAPVDV